MVKSYKRVISVLSLLLTAGLIFPVYAFCDYKFSVPKYEVDVYVANDDDASITIIYELMFQCFKDGKAIDFVDIGLPNKHFNPSDFKAVLNGYEVHGIAESAYVKHGIEVPLGKMSINPGQRGMLRVEGKVKRMVRYDSGDKNYTSVKFAPTYWDSAFTMGTTNVKIRMHFPKGVTANETKWHMPEPDKKVNAGDHMVFTWILPNVSPGDVLAKNVVGIGFPTSYVKKVYKVTLGQIVAKFFTWLLNLIYILFPVLIIGFVIFLVIRLKKRRMMKYLPPELAVEGVGIKRGLTAPQAALLQEMPLDKIMTMILFGLMRKGTVKVRKSKHFKLRKLEKPGLKLRDYENQFLECIKKDGGFSKRRASKFAVKFIKDTNRKVKGFSRKETVDYYGRIAEEAWLMVENAGTPEVAGDAFGNKSQWLMMDEDFGGRFAKSVKHETIPMPRWWISYGGAGGTPGQGGGLASISDFASSITNSITDFSSGLVTDVSNFTSKITGKTNPPPVSTYSGGSGGGGSGCACACACAGCACACAGGGR